MSSNRQCCFSTGSTDLSCEQNERSDQTGYIDGTWPPDREETSRTPSLGTITCPWQLRALPGQQIRLYLVDISLSLALESNENYQRDVCPLYLVVMEMRQQQNGGPVAGPTRDIPLCNSNNARQSLLYESSWSTIEIYTESHGDQPQSQPVFFFQYEGMPAFYSVKPTTLAVLNH